MNISKEDQDRIASAIRSAEAKTSGEIVCVLAQTSSHATALPVFIAAVVALALPWLLTTFTAMTVYRILSLQVIVFLALLMLLCLPRVRVALMPRRARRADRLSCRHGAVHEPRTCEQQKSVREY